VNKISEFDRESHTTKDTFGGMASMCKN